MKAQKSPPNIAVCAQPWTMQQPAQHEDTAGARTSPTYTQQVRPGLLYGRIIWCIWRISIFLGLESVTCLSFTPNLRFEHQNNVNVTLACQTFDYFTTVSNTFRQFRDFTLKIGICTWFWKHVDLKIRQIANSLDKFLAKPESKKIPGWASLGLTVLITLSAHRICCNVSVSTQRVVPVGD